MGVSNESSTCHDATSTSSLSSGPRQHVLRLHMARSMWQATCIYQTSRRAGTTPPRPPSHASALAYACLGPHKNLCTLWMTSGTLGSLLAITMLALRQRNLRIPRLQRLTQCFTARTDATTSTPHGASS